MVQPYNYSMQTTPAQMAESPLRGLGQFQAVKQQQQQIDARNAELERQKQAAEIKPRFDELTRRALDGDDDAARELFILNPEMAAKTDEFMGVRDEKSKSLVGEWFSRYMSIPDEKKRQYLIETAESTPFTADDEMLAMEDEQLRAYEKIIAPRYMTKEQYAAFKPQDPMSEYQTKDLELKTINTGIRQQEAALRRLEQQIKREGDDIKREELELKVQERRDKLDSLNKDRDIAKTEREVVGENAITGFDRSLGVIDEIYNHPSLDAAVGVKGPSAYLPGTDTQEVISLIETLQSQSFLNEVEKMKGLGALTEREGAALTTAVGSLNRDMSEKAFKRSLDRIRGYFEQAKENTKKKYSVSSATETPTETTVTTVDWSDL